MREGMGRLPKKYGILIQAPGRDWHLKSLMAHAENRERPFDTFPTPSASRAKGTCYLRQSCRGPTRWRISQIMPLARPSTGKAKRDTTDQKLDLQRLCSRFRFGLSLHHPWVFLIIIFPAARDNLMDRTLFSALPGGLLYCQFLSYAVADRCVLKNASKSALIWSALVAGMPCGKPG